ncbi:MAG: HAD-IA family hydrolase [Bacteroidales bacterium]|nr:HAD-IA family hydrolase [Bacteroidales bacterium]
MTRLLALDFDGTLADTRPLIVASMQRTLAEMGLPARSEAECAAVIGLPLAECFVRVAGVDGVAAERCAEVYRRLFDEHNHPGAVTLFPHVLSTLSVLHRRGVRLAVCSSRARATLDAFVRGFGLEPMVEMVVGADDVAHAKPHPEPVLRVLGALGVGAGDTLVVGDTSFDILMGAAAGCRTCGVTYGNQSASELRAAGADWLIDDFAALEGLVGD